MRAGNVHRGQTHHASIEVVLQILQQQSLILEFIVIRLEPLFLSLKCSLLLRCVRNALLLAQGSGLRIWGVHTIRRDFAASPTRHIC